MAIANNHTLTIAYYLVESFYISKNILNGIVLIKYERYIILFFFVLFYINVLHQITLNNEILMKRSEIYSIWAYRN